jgi:glycosyltransferase involved in cell wall biosynthesis
VKIALLAQAGSAHIKRWSIGLAARGHHIRLISNSELSTSPPGIDTVFLPGKSSFGYIWNIPRVRRILQEFRPDVVHAHYATGYGLWGSAQDVAPLVVSVWGTDIDDALAKHHTVGRVVRRVFRKARFITATSRYLVKKVLAFDPSVADKVRYVPFGVSISPLDLTARDKNERDGVLIVFAKVFLPTYAPELVIDAFAAACRTHPGLRLIMIGGGPLEDDLRRRAAVSGVSDRIDIRGWVDPDEATMIIRRADIMVMPSRKEAFGVAALEAIASGVPVIATNIGGIPEIIQDGINGILISPDDREGLTHAVERLASDKQLRRTMGAAGIETARRDFDGNDALDRMDALYREAAQG